MKRTFLQIIQILAILVVVLMIPLFIESNSLRSNVKKQPELTLQSATSSQVLGISTTTLQSRKGLFDSNQISLQRIALFTIIPLFLVSVLSFTKYKVSKEKV